MPHFLVVSLLSILCLWLFGSGFGTLFFACNFSVVCKKIFICVWCLRRCLQPLRTHRPQKQKSQITCLQSKFLVMQRQRLEIFSQTWVAILVIASVCLMVCCSLYSIFVISWTSWAWILLFWACQKSKVSATRHEYQTVSRHQIKRLLFRPRHSTTYVDVAYCYRLSSVVCLSIVINWLCVNDSN